MKIDKMAEIMKSLAEADGEKVQAPVMNQEETLNALFFLDRVLKRAGFYFTPVPCGAPEGTISLRVDRDFYEGARVFQVKIWDNKEHKIKNRFSLRRFFTDEEGELKAALPEGNYEAVVSCGPAWSSAAVSFTIADGKNVKCTCRLEPLDANAKPVMFGDLHHHAIWSSPAYGGTDPVIESAEDIRHSMQSLGMRFGALSDHHNTINHPSWKAQKQMKTDACPAFVPILSKEISTSNGHVLQLGVDQDVIYEVPKGTQRTEDFLRTEFIRITDEIKMAGGLPQVNHPFDKSRSTGFNPAFWDHPEMFESMEIWNGATPFAHNTNNDKAFHKWLSLLDQGTFLTATSGSDTHNIYGDDYFAYIEQFTWMMETLKENPGIVPVQMAEKLQYLMYLYESILPQFTAWVALSNSPSDVMNAVCGENINTQEEILQTLREGRSYITNGPLVDFQIEDAGPGETARTSDGKAALYVKVYAKEPAGVLLYTGADHFRELKGTWEKQCYGEVNGQTVEDRFCFICHDSAFDFKGDKYAVLLVDGGMNSTAITNPVFL